VWLKWYIHRVSKNVPPLACYNVDTRERILIFFGRNTTDKVSNQKTLYYATSTQLTCASAPPCKMENMKMAFFTGCISGLPEFNQLLLDLFNLFDSWLTLTLLYDSLNRVINAFSSGLLGAWFRRKEVESAAAVGLCCTKHQCTVFWFPLSQSNAEVLDRWGGETKHHLISYFLSNTSAKNYRSRIVHVKIIASQMWDVFWDTYNNLQHFVKQNSVIG